MMLNKEEKEYYDRHLRLSEFGEEAQLKLKGSSVLVVGAGGLGCPVLVYLAAAGVGQLTIIDPDLVSVSNLHRQVLYTTADVGDSKVIVAARRISEMNPNINVTPIKDSLSIDNALDLVLGHDLVMDCTDNFGTRYLINDACVLTNKPFVYGAISKFSGQVSVFNYKGGPTYRCLFPEIPAPELFPSCSEVGVVGVLPGIVGTLQANECIKILTETGDPLSGKLLMIDSLSMVFRTVKLTVRDGSRMISELGSYAYTCEDPKGELSWNELEGILKREDVLLIDVRSGEEHAADNIGGILLPLNEILSRLNEVPKDKEIIVYCKSGIRSRQARQLLIENGLINVRSLIGGIEGVRTNQ